MERSIKAATFENFLPCKKARWMPKQISKNIECFQQATLTNIQWKKWKWKNLSVLRVCVVHLKVTVYFHGKKQRTPVKCFLKEVPTKLQKSHVLEALLVFSINPQKRCDKNPDSRVFGVWIWNTKNLTRQLVNALNTPHCRPFTMDFFNILHSRHK